MSISGWFLYFGNVPWKLFALTLGADSKAIIPEVKPWIINHWKVWALGAVIQIILELPWGMYKLGLIRHKVMEISAEPIDHLRAGIKIIFPMICAIIIGAMLLIVGFVVSDAPILLLIKIKATSWSKMLVIIYFVIATIAPFWMYLRLLLAPSAILVDGLSIIEAFRRSFKLTKGIIWRLLGLLISLGVIYEVGLCGILFIFELINSHFKLPLLGVLIELILRFFLVSYAIFLTESTLGYFYKYHNEQLIRMLVTE